MEMKEKEVKRYLDQMDAFAGVSQFTVNVEVLNRFPKESNRCFVVYNGVDINKFNPDALDRTKLDDLRKKYGIKQNDIVVSYLGRLRQSKGVHILIEAVKQLIKTNGLKNLKVMLVGSNFFGGDTSVTPFMKKLQQLASEISENVIFTGFIEREWIQNIYGISDIIALPSFVQDASPNVCYEAQAMKVPVISSFRGGIPEILKGGETGLLVDDPESVPDLASKIQFLAQNPKTRKTFGENGRKRVRSYFTWELAAQRTEEMYDKVLGG